MTTAQPDVLIIDDDTSIRIMLRRALERHGVVCSEARDGEEAIACLEHMRCHVILLDLMMPRLDGHGFMQRFKSMRSGDLDPIVFAMSASGEDELRRSNADSVHAIVRKPFDVHAIAEIVALCVSLRSPDPGSVTQTHPHP